MNRREKEHLIKQMAEAHANVIMTFVSNFMELLVIGTGVYFILKGLKSPEALLFALSCGGLFIVGIWGIWWIYRSILWLIITFEIIKLTSETVREIRKEDDEY